MISYTFVTIGLYALYITNLRCRMMRRNVSALNTDRLLCKGKSGNLPSYRRLTWLNASLDYVAKSGTVR